MALRPKWQLDHGEYQGSRVTIPAEPFQALTGQMYPYPRLGTRASSNPGLRAKFILDKKEVQGVMPASTYYALTGKLTTEWEKPVYRPPTVEIPPMAAPTLEFDWGSFAWGALVGIGGTLLTVWGVIPAIAQAGAAAITRRLA